MNGDVTGIIYVTIAYLCLQEETRHIGCVLLTAHVYRDIMRPCASWPVWMEPVALVIAARLIASQCTTVRSIGCIMFLGHCRQIVTGDDKYYTR